MKAKVKNTGTRPTFEQVLEMELAGPHCDYSQAELDGMRTYYHSWPNRKAGQAAWDEFVAEHEFYLKLQESDHEEENGRS
jgi:hypothetical protein